MKTARLSLNQLFVLMVLCLSSSATLVTVGRFCGADVWIAILCSAIFGFILYMMYYRISYLHGFDGFPAITEDIFGKWGGKLVTIGYMGYFFLLTAGLLSSLTGMIQMTIMVDANFLFLMFTLMAPIIYGMCLGINSIGRGAEVMFNIYLLFLILLVLAVARSDIFKFGHLLPILEDGISSLSKDIYTLTLFPYGESIMFLFLFPLIPNNKKGKILKGSYIAFLIATIILIGIDVMNVGILGSDLMENFTYPFFNAMKMAGVNVLFERIDPVAIVILMITCFFKLSIYYYAGLKCMEKLTKKLTYRQLSVPTCVFIIYLAMMISSNPTEDIYVATVQNPRYILPYFEVVIPFIIWGISELKYHTNPKQVASES